MTVGPEPRSVKRQKISLSAREDELLGLEVERSLANCGEGSLTLFPQLQQSDDLPLLHFLAFW